MPAPTYTMPDVLPYITELIGGWDQLTPTLKRKPGTVFDAINFECAVQGGYGRCGGYERFDGRAKPSAASYSIVQINAFTNTPTVGQTLTGGTTGTTGQIIALGSNYIVLTLIVGAGFSSTEAVTVGATPIGTAVPISISISSLLNAQYLNLAADVYRGLIGVVPGSGPIRGVVSFNLSGVHNVYAWRDNAGATATVMHKASASGWTAVTMFNEVSFTAGGVTAPADGATLTQGANTATIKRVVLQSGSWAAGTAAGRFIVTAPAPGNFAAGAATIGAVNVTLSGVQTAVAFATGGRFEFEIGNFSGQSATNRLYGADGINRAFEFDGETLVPITTGFTSDAPKHLAIHRRHLFLSFGSSAANSAPGLPYNWTALAGAAEHPCGDTVTGFKVLPGDQTSPALFIGTRSFCKILYGSTALTGTEAPLFDLVDFNPGIGCISYSLQNLDRTYLFDDRGVINMQAAQEFGNFLQASITQNINTYISEKRSLFAYSTLNKDKSQYRLFFSDGSALYVTLVNGKLVGLMPILFPNPAFCAWNGEQVNGNDVSYFGSASGGYVYELDKGSSFDGANIDAYITLSWDFLKSPRLLKTFKSASIEMQSNFYAAISYGYALGYRSSEIDQPTPISYESSFQGGANWDEVTWDQFVWDGFTLSPTEVDMDGTAENVQVTISSTGDYIYPYTVNSIITHYTKRRLMR